MSANGARVHGGGGRGLMRYCVSDGCLAFSRDGAYLSVVNRYYVFVAK